MKLTEEQLKLARECKTKEELESLAKENNIEVTEEEIVRFLNNKEVNDEELDKITGGSLTTQEGAKSRTVGNYKFTEYAHKYAVYPDVEYYFVDNFENKAFKARVYESYEEDSVCRTFRKHRVFKKIEYTENGEKDLMYSEVISGDKYSAYITMTKIK